MAVVRTVLGLDLGTHSLKAVELRQTLRGFEAVQLRVLPRPGDDVPLPDLLRRFIDLHGLGTDHVVVALPGERVSTRWLSFPFRERRRLAQAVPFAVEEELPFDIEDVVIDWQVVGGDRSRAEVAAVFAARSEVSALIEQLSAAGCSPRTIEAEGLVLGNLAAVFDFPGRVLLADLGHEGSTLALLVDGRPIGARSVSVGGRQITEALASDRGVSLLDAERIKCEEGVFGPLGEAPPQTAKVLDRLARELVRTIGAVEDRLGGSGPDRVLLCGGTAQLEGIEAYLSEVTGIPSERLGYPREGQGQGLVAGGPPIVFAPAIALALRGTAQARTEMNFRQDQYALRMDVGRVIRQFRTTAFLAAGALLLAVLGFALRAGLDARRAGQLEAQAEALYAEAFPGQPVPANSMAALRQEVEAANERADFLGVYRGNLSALDLLTEISKRVPASLDLGLEELSIDRQSVRMRVQAKSFQAADRLGGELQKFEPFAATRIGAIETDPKTGGKRFTVTISLKPAGEEE